MPHAPLDNFIATSSLIVEVDIFFKTSEALFDTNTEVGMPKLVI
jgi:hypothetical protein